MTIDRLRKALHAQPFTPFELYIADGRVLRVRHPDFMMLSPSGRVCSVYHEDNAADHIDVLLITGVKILNGGVAT